MLQVSALNKSYGARTLFEDVTFALSPGERLGLVGRNGCGKSTLFRLILDEEHPDDGQIIIPRGYQVGHLEQHLKFTEPTILTEACLGLPLNERDQSYRGEIILSGLGFSDSDMQKAPSEFSGGFQIRINLAKLLLSEPNLLLLDEPTNYLDIISMRWLTSFLRSWPGEMMIISHDRLFLDSVTTHTMLIHRGRIRRILGGTSKLYNQITEDEEIYEKTRVNEEKKRKELEIFINRFRAQASKAALVQSKIKALERMGEKEALRDESTLDFQFCNSPFPGKTLLEGKELTFGYDPERILIEKLSLRINKGDRIGIIGKNGKGKSTLLRLLNGELTALSGSVAVNDKTSIGYFGQSNIARLNPSLTVEQEVSSANTQHVRTKVRTICGTMMFSGDDALKKVSVLSGGEKSRVLLGKILAQPTNLLLLDEPTNHLDMESIEALVTSLKEYDGAVAVVTHSELILSKLATRLVIFDGDTPQIFEHDYDYFLEKIGWGDDEEKPSKTKKKDNDSSRDQNKNQIKKSSNKNPANKEVAAVEKKIVDLERELKTVEEDLAKASSDGEVTKITSLSKRFNEIEKEIEIKFDELEKIS